MKTISIMALTAIFAFAGTLSAQGWGRGGRGGYGNCWANGFPSASITELRGRVAALQLAAGVGMPSVTIQTETDRKLVYLGSMRYLMMQNFNPRIDEEIVVKAFQANGQYFAASVTLPAGNQTIQLRDSSGRPVWRGRRW